MNKIYKRKSCFIIFGLMLAKLGLSLWLKRGVMQPVFVVDYISFLLLLFGSGTILYGGSRGSSLSEKGVPSEVIQFLKSNFLKFVVSAMFVASAVGGHFITYPLHLKIREINLAVLVFEMGAVWFLIAGIKQLIKSRPRNQETEQTIVVKKRSQKNQIFKIFVFWLSLVIGVLVIMKIRSSIHQFAWIMTADMIFIGLLGFYCVAYIVDRARKARKILA